MRRSVRIKLSPAAQGDIRGIWKYSQRKWGAERADEYLNDLRDRMLWLTAHRNLWKERADLGDCLFCYNQQNHVTYFRQSGDSDEPTIEIIRILHQRMDPERRV